MRMVLEIEPGSVAPRSVAIEAGAETRVGRMAPSRIVLEDQTVSRQHFAIDYDGRQTARLRDLGSTHGTLVNGKPVLQAVLHDGDLVRAGTTTMRVRFVEEKVPGLVAAERPEAPDAAPITAVGTMDLPVLKLSLHDRAIAELRAQGERLYAILDAARDPLVLARLLDCEEEHQSLYEGTRGDQLQAFAPYLVALPRGSAFLETIVRDGWGKSWGVFLTCDRPFAEVRKHLRHFLMVELEGGKQVYFRFYDPRVLRVFLPTCEPAMIEQFFEGTRAYLMEGQGPAEFLEFGTDGQRLRDVAIRLDEHRDLEGPRRARAVHRGKGDAAHRDPLSWADRPRGEGNAWAGPPGRF